MKMVKIISLVVGGLFAVCALADGPGWTGNVKVTKLVVTMNGGINVRVTPELVGCTSQSGYGANYASIYPDHPGINRMQAELITAMTTGTPVSLYLTNSECKVGEMVLGGIH